MEIKIDHLSYIYHPGTPFEKKALDDICLTIRSGEFIGLVGRTGSGKSTLVQHLNGLLLPSEGSILVDGEDITGRRELLPSLRRRVGVVFQYPEYQLFESDVLKDISFGPKNQGLKEEEAVAKARDAMRAVGLDESYEMRSPFELSGGQKRRAAIAGILAMEPEFLVLDEPTAGMDPAGRQEILELLKKINQERGIGVVLVSHSMEDVADYTARVIAVAKGRIRLDGKPAEVFAHVKELEEIGLSAPQVSYVMQALRERSWNVSLSTVTLEEAAQEIRRAVSEEGFMTGKH